MTTAAVADFFNLVDQMGLVMELGDWGEKCHTKDTKGNNNKAGKW